MFTYPTKACGTESELPVLFRVAILPSTNDGMRTS